MERSTWWLTIRLWRGSSWRQIARSALVALGLMMAVLAAFLGTIGPRVQQAQSEVVAQRTPVSGDRLPGQALVQVTESTIGITGSRYHQYLVYAPSATAGPHPAGLPTWPKPGHSIVSKSLKDRTDFPLRAALGHIDDEVLPQSLTASPDEFVSYTRVTEPLSPTTGPQATVTQSFGMSSSARSSALWVLIEVALLILLPALIMMGVMFRLAATANQARTEALFRAGMDPQAVARGAANDAILPVIVGYAASLLVLPLLERTAESQGWLGMSWWPHQAALPWPVHIIAFALLILAARIVSRRASRAAMAPHRARAQRHRQLMAITAKAAGLAPWVCGLTFLTAAAFLGVLVWALAHSTVNTVSASSGLQITVLIAVVAGTLSILGLARVGTRHLAAALGRREKLGLFLGGRVAEAQQRDTASLAAYIAIAVTLIGTVTGFLGVVSYLVEGNTSRAPAMVHYENVTSERRATLADFVQHHQGIAEANLVVDGQPIMVGVGTCENLRSVAAARADMNMGACTNTPSRGAYTQWGHPTVSLPGLSTIALPNKPVTGAPWDIILPATPRNLTWATAQPEGEAVFVASKQDGSFGALLSDLQTTVQPSFIDADVKNPDAMDAYIQQRALIRAGLAVGIFLMLLAFVMTCIELRWRARSTTSMLAAVGTPQHMMRVAGAVQFAIPVVAAGIPAALLGTLAGLAFMAIGTSPAEVFTVQPWTPTLEATITCTAVSVAAGYLFGGGKFQADAVADR